MQKEETIPKLLENRGGTVYTIDKRTSVTAGEVIHVKYPSDISLRSKAGEKIRKERLRL
jgi:hypothetical protein